MSGTGRVAPPGPRASRRAWGHPLTVRPGPGTAAHHRRPEGAGPCSHLATQGPVPPGSTGQVGGRHAGQQQPDSCGQHPQRARGTFQNWVDGLPSKDPPSSAGHWIYFKFIPWGREAGLVPPQSLGGDLSWPGWPGASTPPHAGSTRRRASAWTRPAPSGPPPWSLTDTHSHAGDGTPGPPAPPSSPSDSAFLRPGAQAAPGGCSGAPLCPPIRP